MKRNFKINKGERMSTRGAMGFRIDGVDKVTYNHFDSYPTTLGRDILQDLAHHSKDEMRSIARQIVMINGNQEPTPEQINQSQQWTNLNVSERSTNDWYCLLRKAQGSLKAWLDDGLRIMSDGSEFLRDSLFCEWAYIVNLDDGVLEVYKGFNQRKFKTRGRYASQKSRNDGDFYGVRLIKEIPLEILPKDEETMDKTVEQWERGR